MMSELCLPVYLDKSYFEEILRQHLKNTSVKVKNFTVETCGAKDGFLSTLLRFNVKFFVNSREKIKSFVVKRETTSKLVLEKVGINGFNVHNREMDFFEVIAPQLLKVLKQIGDTNSDVLVKTVVVDRKREVIVFEDLKARGYIMADKSKGLDEEKIKLSLESLAKFHAASLVIYRKHPKVFDLFDIGMFNRKIDAFHDAFLSIFELVVDEIGKWQGFEDYARKLEKLEPSLIEKATQCFDVKPGDFCVLNHGDL